MKKESDPYLHLADNYSEIEIGIVIDADSWAGPFIIGAEI